MASESGAAPSPVVAARPAESRADPAERPRSTFRFPRVEFDLAGLLLGTLAVLGTSALWSLLAWALGVSGPHFVGTPDVRVSVPPEVALRSEFGSRVLPHVAFPGADRAFGVLGYPGRLVAPAPSAVPGESQRNVLAPLGLPGWQIAAVALALLVFWSVAGGALARVYAVRKARDRTVPFDEALGFAFSALPQFVMAPLFAAAAAAFFFAIVVACGAGTAVPFAGPVLAAVLHPVALLAGLVLTVIVVGGVLGYPMTQAAVAVERNGSLDAVSRTYSYVFTRPLTFGFGVLVVLAVGSLIPAFAGWFLSVVEQGVSLGASWDAEGAGKALALGFDAAGRLATPDVPEVATTSFRAWTWGAWAFLCLAKVLAHGFALSYIVGGLVDVYFILREEVDGIPTSEVYEEGVAESLGEPIPGQPAAAAAAAAPPRGPSA